jgi:hypothetical protein
MTKLFWFYKKKHYNFDSMKLKYYEKSNPKNDRNRHVDIFY